VPGANRPQPEPLDELIVDVAAGALPDALPNALPDARVTSPARRVTSSIAR
jgi:hypothetical protein